MMTYPTNHQSNVLSTASQKVKPDTLRTSNRLTQSELESLKKLVKERSALIKAMLDADDEPQQHDT